MNGFEDPASVLEIALTLSKARRYEELEAHLLQHEPLLIDDLELGFRLAVAWLHLRKSKPALALTDKLRARARSTAQLYQLSRIELIRSAFLSREGRLEEAEVAARRAIPNEEGPPATHLAAEASNSLGVILCMRGEWDEALPFFGRAMTVFQQIGFDRGLGTLNHNIALAHRYSDRWLIADSFFARANSYYQENGTDHERAFTESERSLAILGLGDAQLAEAMARRSVTRCRDLNATELLGEGLRVLGTVLRVGNQHPESTMVLEEALTIGRHNSSLQLQGEVHEELGLLSLISGGGKDADSHFASAVQFYGCIGATGYIRRLSKRISQAKENKVLI